ncbi:hypothetical protein ACPCHT_16830 [Nucisporomicrobium flavum]|uniref:hypothetical protein n=1 Tax=Nucisporomicrobium flavum TaxID=2785915 RepID=UPI003C303EF2
MDDLADFISQMAILVREEAPLHEIPHGSRDLVGAGAVVDHGPWPASTCAAVLTLWHRAGWIGFSFRDPPAGWDVAPAEWRSRLVHGEDLAARDIDDILDHPERWVPEKADGHVQPYRTDQGAKTPQEQWFDLVIETARSLPLRPAT